MKRNFLAVSLLLVLALFAGVSSISGRQGAEDGVAAPQAPAAVEGDVASTISYQGSLRENGAPVAGNRNMLFEFWDNNSCIGSAPAISIEKENVPVSDGRFSVTLAVPPARFTGQAYWLKVTVNGTALGCQELLPTAYALSLRPGATIAAGGTALTLSSSSGYALVATTTSATEGAGVFGGAEATSGATAGVRGESMSSTGTGVSGVAWSPTGVTNGVLGYTASSTDGARGAVGWAVAESGQTYGVLGLNYSTQGRGVYGLASNASGETAGVYGESWSPDGTGVFGKAGAGYAGTFFSESGGGVWIQTAPGKQALGVSGGNVDIDTGNLSVTGDLKVGGEIINNAVVNTPAGSLSIYTEESAEAWLTDYGFGTLTGGVAEVTIDPLFAQTVNLDEPYHVFVQVYGNADVYVMDRTPTGFVVQLREGDPDAEFSYRIVAKRPGFEGERLELSPPAR